MLEPEDKKYIRKVVDEQISMCALLTCWIFAAILIAIFLASVLLGVYL